MIFCRNMKPAFRSLVFLDASPHSGIVLTRLTAPGRSARQGGGAICPPRKYKDSKYGPNFSPVPASLAPGQDRSDQTSLTRHPQGKVPSSPPPPAPPQPLVLATIFSLLRARGCSASPRFSPAAAAQPPRPGGSRYRRTGGTEPRWRWGAAPRPGETRGSVWLLDRAGPGRLAVDRTHAAAGKPAGPACGGAQGRGTPPPYSPAAPLRRSPFPNRTWL